MPGLNSFSAALEIRRLHPAARIAILTRHPLPDQLQRARRLKLNGFILKRDDTAELFDAIKTMLTGGFYSPPSMSTLLRDQTEHRDPLQGLTQRERSVLGLYAQGWSIKEIATEMNISVKTAETHRNNLGRKLTLDRCLYQKILQEAFCHAQATAALPSNADRLLLRPRALYRTALSGSFAIAEACAGV